MNHVRVYSPAKVNLRLDIGARRPDGYHDATSIMHTFTLHDTLTMRRESLPGAGCGLLVSVRCETHGDVASLDIPSESNIAYKAVVRLAEALGQTGDEQIDIHIDKSIPHAAGLGGGSSNAAAALVGACALWGLTMEDAASFAQVEAVAASLGADVPFFLRGGCVELGGVGDRFVRSYAPSSRPIVVVRPDAGVSTKAAYEAFDALMADGARAGQADQAGQAAPSAAAPTGNGSSARHGKTAPADCVKSADDLRLYNNLAPASEQVLPQLAHIRQWLAAQPGVARDAEGSPQVLLCGSGSSTFAICESANASYNLVGAARLQGLWARSCSLSSLGVRVIPDAGATATNLGATQRIW